VFVLWAPATKRSQGAVTKPYDFGSYPSESLVGADFLTQEEDEVMSRSLRFGLLVLFVSLWTLLPITARDAPSADEKPDLYAELAKVRKDMAGLKQRVTELETTRAQLAAEVEQLKGARRELVSSWKVVRVDEDGEPKDVPVTRLTFTAKTVRFTYRDGKERTFTYRTDATVEPKDIDVYDGSMRPLLGIYRMAGHQLIVCFDRGNAVRPVSLDGFSPNTMRWTLERDEEGKDPKKK
jgi:uncharacterized protein (TIGR03067 family)